MAKRSPQTYTELAPHFKAFPRKVRLGIVVVGANPVIESFVRVKTRSAERLGIEMVRTNLSDRSDAGKVLQAIQRLVHDTDRKSTRLNSRHSQISYAVF